MDKNAIVAKMIENPWKWADQDPVAVAELEKRIAKAGRNKDVITYSKLVEDVVFNIPTVNAGKPYKINIHDWGDLDRAIIGDFLGYISTRSYQANGFMASVLVVNVGEHMPSEMFFKWMQYLGLVPDGKPSSREAFWIAELKKAYHWYKTSAIE